MSFVSIKLIAIWWFAIINQLHSETQDDTEEVYA